jgi:hypothetical protein
MELSGGHYARYLFDLISVENLIYAYRSAETFPDWRLHIKNNLAVRGYDVSTLKK